MINYIVTYIGKYCVCGETVDCGDVMMGLD